MSTKPRIIKTGTIKNKDDKKHYTYEMRVLMLSDIKEILDLQHEILSVLQKKFQVYISEMEVKEMINGNGEMAGIYVNNTLVAFAAVLYPGKREDNLGRDLGFKSEELMKVAHLEFSAVHKTYRGNSLQKILADYLFEKVIRDGRWSYLLNTISPSNPISLKSTFQLGLVITALAEKYGGLLRYILIYDIKKPKKVDKNTIISVSFTDLDRQQELLQQGYYGIGFEDDGRDENILYAKMEQE